MAKRKKQSKSDDFADNYYGYFQPSRPIPTDAGIKSRSQYGAFASNWWAKRWLAVLESYGLGSRLQRGRSYARSGQVLNIAVEAGAVHAQVQGSRPKPYNVTIEVNRLADGEWEQILDLISEQAIYSAQLLDGTMPQDIEALFTAASIPLFPAKARDITTNCSCPDAANPCKHIAAVYYLLGEEFDRDPFLIFALRGRDREQLSAALRQRRAAAAQIAEQDLIPLTTSPTHSPLDATHFWGHARLEWALPVILAPKRNALILQRLGLPPADTQKSLETLYLNISKYIEAQLMGTDETDT
jgi:uncharacterized Zn finger protein